MSPEFVYNIVYMGDLQLILRLWSTPYENSISPFFTVGLTRSLEIRYVCLYSI